MHATNPMKVRYRCKRLNLLLLPVTVLLCACMGNAQPPRPIYYYTLTHAQTGPPLAAVLPCILRVERFSASPPFDSQRIFYADSKSHRNAYAYHQWVVPPGELLPYLFARNLQQSQGFRAVLPPDAALAATHSLHGWVQEFIELDTPRQGQAAATIHLTLISNLDPDPVTRILLQKEYRVTAPSRNRTPAALAEAMSAAVGQIASSAVMDIYRQLSASPTLKN